jgi:MFS family permease
MLSLDARDPVVIPAALLFIFGLTGGGTLPLYYTITRDLFPAWLLGTASGLMNAAAFLGAAFYQPLTGYLLESYAVHSGVFSFNGYRLLLSVFLGSYFLAFIAMLVFKKKVTPLSY